MAKKAIKAWAWVDSDYRIWGVEEYGAKKYLREEMVKSRDANRLSKIMFKGSKIIPILITFNITLNTK